MSAEQAQDFLLGIAPHDLAVVLSAAASAPPVAVRQRQPRMHSVTRAAAPGAREPRIYLGVGPLRPLRLAGGLPAQLAPAGVGDCAGQTAVAHHPACIERLGDDGLVLVHHPSGHLVQTVRPGIGHSGVQPGDAPLSGPVAFRAATMLAEHSVGMAKPALQRPQRCGAVPFSIDDETAQPQIHRAEAGERAVPIWACVPDTTATLTGPATDNRRDGPALRALRVRRLRRSSGCGSSAAHGSLQRIAD